MNQEIHNNDPLVLTIDNCLTVDECNHMIQISKPTMARSLVSDQKEGVESTGRTSSNAWIKHDYDEITLRIGQKIANIIGIPLENAESYQVIHYDINCEYRRHYDSWDHDGSEKTLRCMKYGGARLKTALVYLNDVEEGGSTRLNRLNIDVLPKQGKLLVFENTYSGTNIKHPLSEHAGMPVIKGEKYAFNLWFKEYNAKKLYSDFNPIYYKDIVNSS
jgi:prolyl 4-hydroxylase